MAKEKRAGADSWELSGARTYTAVGQTARGVAKELLSNVDKNVTSILLRVNFFGDSDSDIDFDGDMTVIR